MWSRILGDSVRDRTFPSWHKAENCPSSGPSSTPRHLIKVEVWPGAAAIVRCGPPSDAVLLSSGGGRGRSRHPRKSETEIFEQSQSRRGNGRLVVGLRRCYFALADVETRDPVFLRSRIDTRPTCRTACAYNTADRPRGAARGGAVHGRRLSVLSLGPA